MIEAKKNIRQDRTIKRLVEVNESAKQITVLDSRYYQRSAETFYPSVTTVLGYFPKDAFFEKWTKEVGHNIDIILRKAANEGTQVHTAIEKYINGETLSWIDDWGNAKYSIDVWNMILRFVDFWETYKPRVIASEIHLFSDTLKVAGTADLICEIDGEIWLIDFKTSNALARTYDFQLAVYAQCWNEMFDTPIDKMGILWLKSGKRTLRKEFMTGKGWEVRQPQLPLNENLEIFGHLKAIFDFMNPDMKPQTYVLPTTLTPSTYL